MPLATRHPSRLFLLASLAFATSTSAFALEGMALFEKMVAEAPNLEDVTWGSVNEHSTDSFTMNDVKIVARGGGVTNLKTLAVNGLKETAEDRVSVASVTVSGMQAANEKEGTSGTVDAIALVDADFPFGIWESGLTAEERKQRVTFGTFTISGATLTNKDGKGAFGSLTLADADIPLDWRYRGKDSSDGEPAAPMTLSVFSFTDLSASGKDTSFDLGTFAIKDVRIPTSFAANFTDWMQMASSMAVNDLAVSLGGKKVFSWDSLGAIVNRPNAEGTIKTRSTLDGIFVDLKAIPDSKAQAVFQQLGYDRVDGNMVGVSSYNTDTGRTELSELTMALKDMFDLSMSYAITGYTPEIAQKFAEAQQQIAAGKSPQEVYAPMFVELSKVKLNGLKLALTDKSLTARLLDYQAQQMGTDGDQLAQAAPMFIGMGLGQLGMPDFSEMVAKAVGKFLQEKGTLAVEAAPAEPVSILDVVLKGQADPKVVPDLLNLQISAQ